MLSFQHVINLKITNDLSWGFSDGSVVKNPPANAGDQVWSPGWEDPWEKDMATHSSIFAWRIPGTEEPGGLLFMGPQESDTTKQQ